MENGIAPVPSIFVENGSGLTVPLHRLGDGVHHIVQIADGPVQGRPGIVNFLFGIALRICRGSGVSCHSLHGRKRFPVIKKGAVVLLRGPEALTYVAEGIGIGFFPSSGLGNGKGLVRIENAFFAVQGTVTHHQVPAGTVQPDQLLVGGVVHLLRRPSAHLPFQGVQLVSAVVVIGGSRAQAEHERKQLHQKTSHNAKIRKNL